MKTATFTDHTDGRFPSTMRVVYDRERGMVYVEIESKHDGQTVINACGMPRVVFAERLLSIGGLLP